jgi:hypothetical protein
MKNQLARICSFATESEMGENLLEILIPQTKFNHIVIKKEFRSPQGVPDFLLFKRCDSSIVYVVALELKLRDWRKGLFQAFKYRTFSNAAYVVIDCFFQEEALANVQMFIKSNIGLASFSIDGEFNILFEPNADMPFSEYYSILLNEYFSKQESLPVKKCRFHRSKIGAVNLGQLISPKYI